MSAFSFFGYISEENQGLTSASNLASSLNNAIGFAFMQPAGRVHTEARSYLCKREREREDLDRLVFN